MGVTVEIAKTKWCPMARCSTLITDIHYKETGVGGAACNRAHPREMYDEAKCFANGCMMWRWDDKAIDQRGYCGLAGNKG